MRDGFVVDADVTGYPLGLAARLAQVRRRVFLVLFWGLVWAQHRLFPTSAWPDVIVVYAPSRTPRGFGETPYQFLTRVTRSNRGQNALAHLNIPTGAVVRPIALLNGLTRPSTSMEHDNILSFLLSLLGWVAIFQFFKDMRLAPGGRKAKVEIALLLLLARACADRPTHLVMITSNSVLVELMRQAVSGNQLHQVTEILHGIASTVMEPYYDFFEQHAQASIRYINLIEDLPQFASIEHRILRDAQGQVVINVQLNAQISNSENGLALDRELWAKRPILIIGVFSHDTDYLKSVFFARECKVMQHLRAALPDQTILYSPHPQIGKLNSRLNAVLDQYAITTSPLSTLELTFHAQAAIGTFSSSVFEAALLDRPVLVLPFEDGFLLPALLKLPMITRARTDVGIAPALDAFCQMVTATQATDFDQYADLCRRRLGVQLIYVAPEAASTT